jgi:hypothetical protein
VTLLLILVLRQAGRRANLELCTSIQVQYRLIILYSETRPNVKPETDVGKLNKNKNMTPISDNTIYYTLSTISQTMAALFAVVGTFVIFQIQATEARLINLLNVRANNETKDNSQKRVKAIIAAKKFKEANNFFSMPDTSGGQIDNDITKLTEYKSLIKVAILVSAITIILSIVMLCLVDQIKTYQYFSFMFYFNSFLFVASLILVAQKILETIK